MPRVNRLTLERVARALGLAWPVNTTDEALHALVASRLAKQIEELIRHTLLDLGQKAFAMREYKAREWVDGPASAGPQKIGEAQRLGYQIALQLLQQPGEDHSDRCDCWERWQDFSIESEQAAIDRCETKHTLEGWPVGEPLDRWLYVVVVGGSFARANGLRKGMLAPACTTDGGRLLQVGQVLVCSPCGREVSRENRCICDDAPSCFEPTFWVFEKGKRARAPAWRCRTAEPKKIFFRLSSSSVCPSCGRNDWGRRPILVWVPIGRRPLTDFERAVDGEYGASDRSGDRFDDDSNPPDRVPLGEGADDRADDH